MSEAATTWCKPYLEDMTQLGQALDRQPAGAALETLTDATLDTIEDAARSLVEHGGEQALRARLERVLGKGSLPPFLGAGSPEWGREAQEARRLALINVLTQLRRLPRTPEALLARDFIRKEIMR